ncbi:MAG: MBL fold metallo-hydrolase RNA specificity domain-containing protein [Planctomycetota bacterium]
MKVREVLRMLQDNGWELAPRRDRHRQFKHPSKRGLVTVAGKLSDGLTPGPENGILKRTRMMDIRLDFLGAAGNVTGSSYLLQANGQRLLVDCGLYQERDFKNRNWDPFPVSPQSIDDVLLTHAHLDHCGLLPKLVKEGFKGKIYCTRATSDIARIVMLDSAKIQEEDSSFKKRRHEREGRRGPHPEVPLYTTDDAEACHRLFSPLDYGKTTAIADGIEVFLGDAGHILGSSMIKVTIRKGGVERTVLFSGDVGRWGKPILRDPELFDAADYVVVESTYGDRQHEGDELIPQSLSGIITETARRGGNIVIPSFAIERTQELLYHLSRLLSGNEIPHLTVFVDSPMAVKVTEVFRRHLDLFDDETRGMIERGEHPCEFPGLVMCRTVEESKAINHIRGTVIIIAGSGMCTGGRIKHHLVHNVGRAESTVLFVGYQAVGTLGRSLLDGNGQVRILGQVHRVRSRVERITGFSAHADRDELYRWLSGLQRRPRRVFVTHGEPGPARAFATWLADRTGWVAQVARYREPAVLD